MYNISRSEETFELLLKNVLILMLECRVRAHAENSLVCNIIVTAV